MPLMLILLRFSVVCLSNFFPNKKKYSKVVDVEIQGGKRFFAHKGVGTQLLSAS